MVYRDIAWGSTAGPLEERNIERRDSCAGRTTSLDAAERHVLANAVPSGSRCCRTSQAPCDRVSSGLWPSTLTSTSSPSW